MRRRGLIALLALLVAALAFAAAGCGGKEAAAPPPPAEPAPAEPAAPPAETGAAAEEPAPAAPAFDLKIGNIMSFTGDLAPYGPPIDQGARIAVDIVNESLERVGLTDVSAEIVASEDDQTDAAPGVEAATKLVQSDGVQVIIGALASTVSLAVAESVTVPNQVVQISPASTSGLLTGVEDDGFLWRTPTPDNIQAELLTKLMGEEFGAERRSTSGPGTTPTAPASQRRWGRWKEECGTIGFIDILCKNRRSPRSTPRPRSSLAGQPRRWLYHRLRRDRTPSSASRSSNWRVGHTRTFTTDGWRSPPRTSRHSPWSLTEGMRGTC